MRKSTNREGNCTSSVSNHTRLLALLTTVFLRYPTGISRHKMRGFTVYMMQRITITVVFAGWRQT
jgi:hypothetical protein